MHDEYDLRERWGATNCPVLTPTFCPAGAGASFAASIAPLARAGAGANVCVNAIGVVARKLPRFESFAVSSTLIVATDRG